MDCPTLQPALPHAVWEASQRERRARRWRRVLLLLFVLQAGVNVLAWRWLQSGAGETWKLETRPDAVWRIEQRSGRVQFLQLETPPRWVDVGMPPQR